MAPMAGYTDLSFRQTLRTVAGDPFLICSEMVEPNSILKGGGKKRQILLASEKSDKPLAWQLYGSDPDLMAEAAQWLVSERNADFLDINLGCPKRKIAKRGAGAGLLLTPEKALEIVRQTVSAVKIPVTAKLRLGWDAQDEAALSLAPELEATGLAALTVHGRTALQGYSGTADRRAIAKIVSAVRDLPVIANGDITSAESAVAMSAETGCSGVMIGRAALHNPWLIRECLSALTGRALPPAPTKEEQECFLRRHFAALTELHGEALAVILFRRWIPQYAKTFKIPRPEMVALLQTRNPEDLRRNFKQLNP